MSQRDPRNSTGARPKQSNGRGLKDRRRVARTDRHAQLAAQYMEISGKMTQVADTLDEAMGIALRAVSREDIICITGSFYLIAQAARKYNTAEGIERLAV